MTMPEPGQLVGRYRIERQLGRGGSGATFAAQDEVLHRRVVLKIAEESDPEVAARFEREFAATSRLKNRHVVLLFDHGRLDDGRPYVVREWVEGSTLDKLVPLPVPEALLVLEALAEGLEAAHSLGVIHRDVKPSNVLIPATPEGPSYGDAKLSDFELLGLLLPSSQMTRTGEMFGTPLYMAPEQIRGERQSAATDIYGLGLLLFVMLYGDPPFGFDSLPSLLYRIVHEEPKFPESPTIASAVREFIDSCLRKDPLQRPKSAREVRATIRALKVPEAPAQLPRRDTATDSTMATSILRPATSSSLEDEPRTRAVRKTPPAAALRPPLRTARGAPARKARSVFLLLVAAGVAISLVSVVIARGAAGRGVWSGLALVGAGALSGFALRRWLARFRRRIDDQVEDVLFGARRRRSLSESLAVEVDRVLERCSRWDQRVLGMSIALMVDEYGKLRKSRDRQALLLNVVELMEKLRRRLTPWYVRHERVLALLVSLIGVVSGAVKVVESIGKLQAMP